MIYSVQKLVAELNYESEYKLNILIESTNHYYHNSLLTAIRFAIYFKHWKYVKAF